jgi:hypothetical protein
VQSARFDGGKCPSRITFSGKVTGLPVHQVARIMRMIAEAAVVYIPQFDH